MKSKKATPAGDSGNKDHTVAPPPEVTEQKGGLLIRDLWQQGTDNVHDIRFVNTDAPTHRMKDPARCLHEAERGKSGYTWRLSSSSDIRVGPG